MPGPERCLTAARRINPAGRGHFRPLRSFARATGRFRSWPIAAVLLVAGQAFAGTGKLEVRVVDAASGLTIPARLVLRDSGGDYPGDRLAVSAERWPHVEAHGVFIDGEETFDLPSGSTIVTAAHGLEYRAANASVEVPEGGTAAVELRLERAIDMRAAGWVAGDLHVHMIHGEQQRHTSYEDVSLTCAANGLDFVSVCQEYVGAGTLDLDGYQAECRRVSTDRFQMFIGAEGPQSLLGHQVLLGCDDPFVIPEDPPYFEGARAVHEQGGAVVYVHPVRYFPGKQYNGEWLDFPGNNLARELIFDAYAGPSFDGLSVLSDEPADANAHQLWFHLLNHGCFVPAFADSDACFDRPTLGLKAPGFWSTYFYIGLDTPVTQAALVEAVRHGRTFATTGPLVQFRIDDQISGGTLAPDGKPHVATIRVIYPQHAFSLETADPKTGAPAGIARIELVRNGEIVRQWQPGSTEAEVTHTITETDPCWYAVRVFGTDEHWQVALASPIYFASKPVPPKREPLATQVRGRIYDFLTGEERSGDVEVRRHGAVLKKFRAEGQFRVEMTLDAEIVVEADGFRPLRKNLLMDYGPVHQFLWSLESRDLGRRETFELFEHLVGSVELEFPLGHRLPGCYFAADLPGASEFNAMQVLAGPERASGGSVAVAAVLTDAEQIAPGDALHVAAVFRDEGAAAECGPFVVEARGYDPSRPTGFGALKSFASFEATWDAATDLGEGYRLISGTLAVPGWVKAGPTGAIDLSVRARRGSGDAAFVGLAVPLGATGRALCVSSSWPNMPLSWPDRNYGIGPLKVCNRIGRAGRPLSDYRELHLALKAGNDTFDLLPARDGRGCADADDAVYNGHFLDQVLSAESRIGEPDPVRPQPAITWRDDVPLIDASP